MIYIGYNFVVSPLEPGREILIAELAEVGFESFVETSNGVSAYILKDDWKESILNDIQILGSDTFKISFDFEEIEQVNWNSEWEKNFNPIIIDKKVSIRAPFHKKPKNIDYDIVIEPKMSFGTGHHETTYLMVQHILELDIKGKKVLDMGCGTGILAILAEKRGAAFIEGIDIDTWCYENSIENVDRNNCTNIRVYEGDASLLKNKVFDVIIANINRNILLNDISKYVLCLNKDGVLLLSGFYKKDIPIIEQKVNKNGFKLLGFKEKNNWVSVKFVKL